MILIAFITADTGVGRKALVCAGRLRYGLSVAVSDRRQLHIETEAVVVVIHTPVDTIVQISPIGGNGQMMKWYKSLRQNPDKSGFCVSPAYLPDLYFHDIKPFQALQYL